MQRRRDEGMQNDYLDAHSLLLFAAQAEADMWNEHMKLGSPVIVEMKSGALVKSRVQTFASVGIFALRAGVQILGIGYIQLNRIKRSSRSSKGRKP